jgi:hypothetical protein
MGIIKFFPSRESLISDIPAGDGKIVNLFYSAGWEVIRAKGRKVHCYKDYLK